MKDKVIFITDAFPHKFHGGGNVTSLNVLKSLKNIFNVYVIFLNSRRENLKKKNYKVNKKLFFINQKLDKKSVFRFFPLKLIHIFLFLHSKNEINSIISSINPKKIFCYGYDSMSVCYDLQNVKKIAMVGDPPYLPLFYRIVILKKYFFFKKILTIIYFYFFYTLKTKIYKKHILSLIKRFDKVGAFAHHHAHEDLRCEYFRTPIDKPRNIFRSEDKNNKHILHIIHVGHMRGTVTFDGICNLVFNVIPKIQEKNKDIKIKVTLVGKYYDDLPLELRTRINFYGFFKFVGHINPIEKIFKNGSLLIVPNEIDLGVRVRILTALAYGLPVVTHSSNLRGIPELRNNYNCIVGKNSDQLAQGCIKIFKDNFLEKKLVKNSKITFNNFFSIKSFKQFIKNIK